jgi:hypothetical protein
MTVYVYAIAEAPPPVVSDLVGIDGGEIRTLARGDLAAAFTALPGPEALAASTEAFLAHERVVEALMRQTTVLPTRFGTTLPGERELASVLDREALSFRELLARVRGCVELSLRVRWEAEAERSRGGEGSRYLDERRRERDEAERAAAAVHLPLARLARSSTSPTTGDGLLAAAYLVPSEYVRPFAEQVRALQDVNPALDLSCTGPWPPYSFVEMS